MGEELSLVSYLDKASAIINHSRSFYVAGQERDIPKEQSLAKAWEEEEKKIIALGYRPLGLNELACYLSTNRSTEFPNLSRLKKGERALSHANIYQKFILGKINTQENYSPERRAILFGAFGLPRTSRYAERIRQSLKYFTNKTLETLTKEREMAIQNSEEHDRDGVNLAYIQRFSKEKRKIRRKHLKLIKEHNYL